MENGLKRKYGLFTAICLVVGIVVGSGVFFKAQTILQKTGKLSDEDEAALKTAIETRVAELLRNL